MQSAIAEVSAPLKPSIPESVEAPPRRVIQRDETFIDSENRILHRRTEILPDGSDGKVTYVGSGSFTMHNNGQPVGQVNFNFTVPGASLEEAFENLKDAAENAQKEAFANARREMISRTLASGAAMPPPPRGKRLID